MEKYAILLGYFNKQMKLINRLYEEIQSVDVGSYDTGYVFALKTQQFYTALEDLFKQIAKTFENHIDNLSAYHKELLIRMNTEIPRLRPAILSNKSLVVLDEIRAFRHFIRHAYDCELDPQELKNIQAKLRTGNIPLKQDLETFRDFLLDLISDL